MQQQNLSRLGELTYKNGYVVRQGNSGAMDSRAVTIDLRSSEALCKDAEQTKWTRHICRECYQSSVILAAKRQIN